MPERHAPPSSSIPVPDGPVLVVGDIICDHYVWGDVERISPEAPVQVLRWRREADRPGGAANAAMNLAALGCRVSLAGLVGNDDAGRWVLRALRDAGIDVRGVVQSKDRSTTVKTRVIARGQHILRIDREPETTLNPRDERRLVSEVTALKRRSACVVCSDYNKGVLSEGVLEAALRQGRQPFSVVDPKGRDFSRYRGANVVTPNENELREAVHDSELRTNGDEVVRRRAETLMRRLNFPALLVTRGASGMDLFERDRRTIRRTHIPALQRHEVFDVTGAGDTVAAVLAMAASSGAPLTEAAKLANAAAGIVVGMVGTAVVESETLARVMDGDASQARSKVLSARALAARIAEARSRGATVVFASGTFDSLNIQHLRTLQQARARGDLLVVGVSDPSPAGSQRAEMLAALRFVDYVTVLADRTPSRLIRELRPDVIV